MLCRITKAIRQAQTMVVSRRFATEDWTKDREKAAEKEFTMREEKKKMQELKQKLKEEGSRRKFIPLGEDEIDIDVVLADREWLIVR